ncbi:hypothetical protein [Paenibacillus sp. GM2]|uniref:hypothetical protein n=1 Tax=Paenibacillus sp. GM2 TaxID=1622070 RepID=UPI0008387310|nr:hypothetical protein [Paenibacillus sp. GM2]
MDKVDFHTYEVSAHNPFECYPEGKYIIAAADDDGRYELHIRHTNGLGLTSKNKMTLLEAVTLSFHFRDELSLPASAIWIDLPNHVLDQPIILNRKVKEMMKRLGMYWK